MKDYHVQAQCLPGQTPMAPTNLHYKHLERNFGTSERVKQSRLVKGAGGLKGRASQSWSSRSKRHNWLKAIEIWKP